MIVSAHQMHSKNNTQSATTVASVAVKLLHLLQKQKQQTFREFKNTFRQNNAYSIYGNVTA